ncbi:conjugal transfer protein TraF [Teredinibacter purpureus]|uniref:conjugal transfer protein TraF n=1 Tax=Teredinibacter purpureus TaxID=2731756 RepID=UPI0005F88D84|nr:conjugal transfer protein TraF [Teredinibacter purpureus]
MKKVLFTVLVISSAQNVIAGSNGLFIGANHTTGNIPSSFSIHVASKNPAAASLAVSENNNFRFNYLPTVWNTYELGEVDNFIDDLDELIDILDDPASVDEPIEEVLDRFNNVLVEMGESGYSKTSLGLTAPLSPFYYRAEFLDATLFADFNYGANIGMSILDDELIYDSQNGKFATNTSAYLKSGLETRLSAGLSKELATMGEEGKLKLYGGVKINFVRMELSKQIIALQQLNGEAIEDVVQDSYDQNMESTTNVGLDIGLMLQAPRYRAGLTITDINSPTYNYGAIGVECDGFDPGSIERSNCDTAAYFIQVIGEIVSQEKHTRHALTTLDGVYSLTGRWSISGEMEMAVYEDIIGHENQWLTLATDYQTKSNWWPDWRAGFRKNMAGSELSTVNIGLTFFSRLTLDGSWGLESVVVDEVTVPRTFGFSVGFQQKF